MKSRTKLRMLTITSLVALVMMMLSMFSVPATTYADGFGDEPPQSPYPTDTLDCVSPDTTSTATALSETTDPSLLDVVITIIDVIL